MVGILLGYLVSYLYIEEVGGWRSMYGVSILPAAALGLGMVSDGSITQDPCFSTMSVQRLRIDVILTYPAKSPFLECHLRSGANLEVS